MIKKIAIAVLCGIFLIILACTSLLLFSRNKTVTLSSLLLDKTNFPETWQVDEESIEVNWQPTETITQNGPNTKYSAQQSTSRTWTDNGNKLTTANLQIDQHIFQYNTPLEAIWWYYANYPERIYAQQWPTFTFPEQKKNRYPLSWKGSPTADQEHVVCAMGGYESCQLWFYRARYGQYILEARFFGVNMGIDEDLFEQIIYQMDTQVASTLSKAK